MYSTQFKVKALTFLVLAAGFISCQKNQSEEIGPNEETAGKEISASPDVKSNIASGSTYEIPVGSISDHSNASITGSIAWYFAQHDDEVGGNTYILSSSATYSISNTLVIPVNSTLGEKVGVNAIISANAAWIVDSTPYMVLMNNSGTTVSGVELNGQFRAKQIVSGNGDNVKLLGITAHRSQKIHDGHLIVFSTSSNVTITDCLLRRAGCDTEVGFSREASLIYARKCTGLTIKNNDMAIAASAGVNYTGSINVVIAGNEISDTGRANVAGFIADGITSYHNGLGFLYQNVWITSNKIWNSRNHGIHVSGRDIHIEDNIIYNSGLTTTANNIRIGDQYSPADCSSNVTIKNNTLSNCPASGRPSIYILGPYKVGTVTTSPNTGCNGVFLGNTCT